MKRRRILLMVHETLVPPDDLSGLYRDGDRGMPDRIQRDVDAAAPRPRGARRRRRRPADRAARGDAGLAPARRLQPARGVLRHRLLRPLRGRLPRADAAAVHRLQSARHDDLARQGADQAGARLAPHPDATLPALPGRPALSRAAAAELSAVRQVGDRRRLARHLAGVRRRGHAHGCASAWNSFTTRRAATRSSRSTSTGASCTSACSATSA